MVCVCQLCLMWSLFLLHFAFVPPTVLFVTVVVTVRVKTLTKNSKYIHDMQKALENWEEDSLKFHKWVGTVLSGQTMSQVWATYHWKQNWSMKLYMSACVTKFEYKGNTHKYRGAPCTYGCCPCSLCSDLPTNSFAILVILSVNSLCACTMYHQVV